MSLSEGMTWRELTDALGRLPDRVLDQQALFIEDIDGPDQRPSPILLVLAPHTVYDGISCGTMGVVPSGGPMLICPRDLTQYEAMKPWDEAEEEPG